MLLGALIDSGLPFSELNAELERLHIDDFRLERPSLDDVFLTLTGHSAPTEETPTDESAG
jgi:hypothetical protein